MTMALMAFPFFWGVQTGDFLIVLLVLILTCNVGPGPVLLGRTGVLHGTVRAEAALLRRFGRPAGRCRPGRRICAAHRHRTHRSQL